MAHQIEPWPNDHGWLERGIGCVSVVPAAIMGFAGLADYAGPTGWRGLSEFVGWTVVCVAAGFGVGSLLRQWWRSGWRRYAAVLLAIAAVVLFTYALNWLGLDAPMTAKIVFTTLLQVIGSLGAVGLILWLGYVGCGERCR